MIEWLNANAGAVTAVATAVYAVVTLVLAWEARQARRGAVVAAERADAAVREERELSVLPYLAAELSATWQRDGSLALEIAAVNVSGHPALRVTVELLNGPWDGSPPTSSDARARLLRDSPRFYAVVAPGAGRKPFGWQIQASDVHESTIARMHYFGPLGGSVWQTYELTRRDRGRFTFKDLQRYVLSSAPGAGPIVT